MHQTSSLSAQQREAAVALFEAGLSRDAVATQLNVSASAVKRLHDRCRLRGAGALVTKPTKRSFSFEFKLDIVRRFLDGETAIELARKHDLSSPKEIERWVRQYRRDGEDALRPKRKGRPPASEGSPPRVLTELEQLRRENQRLAAENAYLKKLRALRAQERG